MTNSFRQPGQEDGGTKNWEHGGTMRYHGIGRICKIVLVIIMVWINCTDVTRNGLVLLGKSSPETHGFLPSNIGFSCKISHHPIL